MLLIESPMAQRTYERSSAFRRDCKVGTALAREEMFSLRGQIEIEIASDIEVIRERKDADTYERELKAFERSRFTRVKNEELEKLFAELEAEKKKVKQEKPALPSGLRLEDLSDEEPEVAQILK